MQEPQPEGHDASPQEPQDSTAVPVEAPQPNWAASEHAWAAPANERPAAIDADLAKKKPGLLRRILLHPIVLLLLFVGVGMAATLSYFIFGSNTSGSQTQYLLLPTGIEMGEAQSLIEASGMVGSMWSFDLTAKLMRFNKVKPGRYAIRPGMSNYELVAALRSGNQSPVDVRFEACRTATELAAALGKNLEVGPKHIEAALNDTALLSSYGFNKQTRLAMFIPNTYSMFWTTTPQQLMDRMFKEYQQYWTPQRRKKAEDVGLTTLEVSVLASIVQAESQKVDEQPTIAGVYLNRLRKGWPLQADPTVIFATGDFSIRRVLNKHLQVDSPYNTYKYQGLPPGPINCPSVSALDAVLNYHKHDYMFFCAKADFSGYHAFAVTSAEHSKNAALFHKKLNELNIKQ